MLVSFPKKLVFPLAFMVAKLVYADALDGCVDSPENPTLFLAMIGLVAAATSWLKEQMAKSSRQASTAFSWVLRVSLVFLLTGVLFACGGSDSTTSSQAMSGTVMGGRQPIAGSKVYVFDVSASSTAAPVKIGTATTGSNGTFAISSFTTTPSTGDLIYVIALGGDAGGGGVNASASLMSVVGLGGSSLSSVQINELTTVASVSQLTSYISQVPCASLTGNATAVGSCPSILGRTSGWSTEVAAIASLVNAGSGQTAVGISALDQKSLNMQASVLANCVNSTGGVVGDSSACGNLFSVAGSGNTVLNASLPATTTGHSPYIVTLSPNGNFAYVTNNADNTVSAFSVNKSTGALTAVGSPVVTGRHPSDVVVSPNGNFVYVANITDNTLSIYSVNNLTGALTPSGSVGSSGPFGMVLSSNGNFAFVLNFGTNSVSTFTVNTITGGLHATGSTTSTGNDPYWIASSPNGHFIYVVNNADNTISAYSVNSITGALTALGLPVATGNGPLCSVSSTNGNFVYVVNSLGNTISTYSVNSDGTLAPLGSPVPTGSYPTNIAVSPNGNYIYVLNYNGSTISIYSIDNGTGALTALGSPVATGSVPNNMAVSSNGNFVYLTNVGDNTVWTYGVAPSDTLSSLLELQNNPTSTASDAFGLVPATPVFSPVPTVAPSTLALP